jgi:hypothetical protein
MLVTFHSKDHYPITMFGEPALQLIQLMGAQPKVPGAFYADDVPQALWQLQEALADVTDVPMTQPQAEEPAVGLKQRALPLLDMLKAAVKAQHSIHWD